MLVYNARFPVSICNSIQKLLRIGCGWQLESPHCGIVEEIKASINLDKIEDEVVVENGSEKFTEIYLDFEGNEYGGIRYENEFEEKRWISEIVGKRNKDSYWISVKVRCDSVLPMQRTPPIKKPYIIKKIMQNFDIGYDGEYMPVASGAICLKEEDVDIADKIIQCKIGCLMPVVYVSSCDDGTHVVDHEGLAEMLSGMAHVVVEPSRRFSFLLKEKSNEKNAYGGAIGIYWPDGVSRWFYVPRSDSESDKIFKMVVVKISESLLSQRDVEGCSWSKIQNVKSTIKRHEISQHGSNKIDEYILNFDSEIAAKDDEIKDLQQEVNRLNALMYGKISQRQSENSTGLIAVSLDELYPGEILDTVLEVLSQGKTNFGSGSRSLMIIEQILQENQMIGNREDYCTTIKNIFKDYRKMTPKIRGELDRCGFQFSEKGKHYKIKFYGDDRYVFSLPKTSSDVKSGKNIASQINNALF